MFCAFTSVIFVSVLASSPTQFQQEWKKNMKNKMLKVFEKFGKNVTSQGKYERGTFSNGESLWMQSNTYDKHSCGGTNYETSSALSGECIEDLSRFTCLSNGEIKLESFYPDKPGCPSDSLYQILYLDTNTCYDHYDDSYIYVCSNHIAPKGDWYATL
jgi:hypothetical protein